MIISRPTDNTVITVGILQKEKFVDPEISNQSLHPQEQKWQWNMWNRLDILLLK
jgi:hypothetical protein